MLKYIFFLMLLAILVTAVSRADELSVDNTRIQNYSERMKNFYNLDENQQYRDVTDEVLASPDTHLDAKDSIRAFHRRIFIFKYPSDGLEVKGFISFTPEATYQPLEILFRGGNQDFGLLNPGDSFATFQNVTVISSTLRGGVSQGQDEFGKADLADIKNMLDYLPTLEHELGIQLTPRYTFALGESRGAAEMFLALAHYPELQEKVNSLVSLSGLLDLEATIAEREDMRQMFVDDFGYQPGVNDAEWINPRNPMNAISNIQPTLPILVIHGSADIRIGAESGRRFVQKLEANGNPTTYWEIDKASHSFNGHPDLMALILHWTEQNSITRTYP